jgi:RNA polymerase sigma-70 factor, ECF subfamily
MPSKNETTDDSLHLHVKLISGDPTASTQIAEKHLPRLIMDLKRKFPQVEDHAVETAAEDALMNYLLHPNRFDPSRLPLHNYLRMSARGDLLNVLRRHKVTSDSSRFGEVVELDRLNGEQDIEDLFSPSVDDITLYRNSPVWERLLELLPDPIDQEIVLLMIENIRSTEAYADILGLLDLPPDEQMREVKRHKDRIKKRLQRHLQRSELEQHE